MGSYRVSDNGDWVEVNPNTGEIVRVLDEGSAPQEIQPFAFYPPNTTVEPSSIAPQGNSIDYIGRARAFNIRTGCLALPVGFLSGGIVYLGFDIPLVSVLMLTCIIGGYSLIWLVAYFWNEITSNDGIALIHALMGWQYLRREQRERHQYYREMYAKNDR